MKLSKFVKKITSVGLAAAMVVSGFTYQPAKAEAAETPVVTVLGATLSLDAEAGKQSMRVAIKVENADNASACGMSITYNGKKLDFSTDDDRYNKLYDIDADSNAIVYTVKIANIPSANFGDNFTIEGFATPITGVEEGEKVTTEAPVEKSVDGVVAAISAQDNSIAMKNSKLVKKMTSLDIANVASLSSSGDDRFLLSSDAELGYSSAEYDSENNCAIISTYDNEDNEASFTGRNSNDTNQLIGLVYRFVQGRDIDYVIEITVDSLDDMGFIGTWEGVIAPKTSVQEGEWLKLTYEITAGGWWNYGFRTTTPKSYKLKEYSIYKVLKSGDIKDTNKLDKSVSLELPTGNGTGKYNDSIGRFVINDNSGDSVNAWKLPEEVTMGKTVRINIKGSYTGDSGFRIWLGNGSSAGSTIKIYNNNELKQGEFDETFDIVTGDTNEVKDKCTHLTFKGIATWSGGKGYINGLEIEKISVQVLD